MWKALLTCFTFAILLTACQKNKQDCDPQAFEQSELKGSWKDSGSNAHNLGGFRYNIVFESDSFRRKTTQWTDALIMDCQNVGINHSTGQYFLEGNRLILDGYYSDSTYSAPFQDTSCAQFTYFGEFRDTVFIQSICDTLFMEQDSYPKTSKLLKE